MEIKYVLKEQKERELRQTIMRSYAKLLSALKSGEAYPVEETRAAVQKMYAAICSNGSSEAVKNFLRHDVDDFVLTMDETKKLYEARL